MASLNKSVNQLLGQIREVGGTGKGVIGEDAVFQICEQMYQRKGGILYHSYEYKVDPTKEGNIKRHSNGDLYIENLGTTTEIDVMYISPYRVFPIEVKTYKAKKIVLTDDKISGCAKTDKSPVHQNEMHCRHLYPMIYRVLPKGITGYIVPIVVFVDECTVEDSRSQWQKDYIKVTTLNGIEALITNLDKPLDYRLDLNAIARVLKEGCSSCKKCLPCRILS